MSDSANDKVQAIRDRIMRERMGPLLRDGALIESERTGTKYRLTNVNRRTQEATIVRETPKVKGKAARKAERRARRERGLL